MLVERNDAKVGLFVMLCLALALGLVALVNARKVVEGHWPLKVRLASLEGVAMGTEVQLQGFRVGQVEAVELQSRGVDYSFVATLSLREDIKLWEGTSVKVVPKGLGSVALELKLPAREDRQVALKPGAEVEGTAGPSLAAVLAQAEELMKSFRVITDEIGQKGGAYFTDTPQIRALLQQVQATLVTYQDLGNQARVVAEKGGRSLEGLDRTLASVKESTDAIQGILKRKGPDLEKALEQLPLALSRVDELARSVQATLKDVGPEAEATLKALRLTLESSQELLALLKARPRYVLMGTPTDAAREKARKEVADQRKADEARHAKPPQKAPAP